MRFLRNFKNFIPLFILYLVIVTLFSRHEVSGDESRHLRYATNITHGYYANPGDLEVANGPGYPLFLVPMVALGLPYWLMRSVNIFLLFGAVWYMYKALRLYIPEKQAILCAYLFGLYPTIFKWLPKLYSEALGLFLLAGFIYYALVYVKAQKQNSRHLLYAGLFLGFLTLTKYVFIHLLLATLAFLVVAYLFTRKKEFRLYAAVFALGCLVYAPFVIHTLVTTDKFMLTGDNGAEILYWRTTPFPEENGDWISFDVVQGKDEIDNLEGWAVEKLQANHLAFIQEIKDLPLEERSRRMMQKALENIKANPMNFIRNTAGSFLRLFFNFPHSYTTQKFQSFFYILPGSFLFVFTMLGVLIALFNYKMSPLELLPFFLLGLMYIGELTLLNGTARNLLVISPLLFLFNAYVWNCQVQIKLRNPNEVAVASSPLSITTIESPPSIKMSSKANLVKES